MAHSFDINSAAVIAYQATLPPSQSRRSQAWLLWPCLAFRVVVPSPQDGSPLNLFSMTALRLCASCEIHRAEDLARLMGLETDLCRRILRGLLVQGLLDHTHSPTPEGLDTLLRTTAPPRLACGWIFQALDGQVLPWFQDSALPTLRGSAQLLARKRHQMQVMELNLGTEGEPDVRKAHIFPSWPSPRRPERSAVLKACEVYMRQHLEVHASQSWSLEQCQVLDTRPRPCLLLTGLYVPRDEPTWRVRSLFGDSPDPSLREAARAQVQARALLREVVGEAFDRDPVDIRDELEQSKEASARRVSQHLARGLEPSEELAQLLLEMEDAWSRAGSSGGDAHQAREAQQRRRDFYLRAHGALERWLGEQLRGIADAPLTLTDDAQHNVKEIQRQLRRQLSIQLPDEALSLLRITSDQLKGILQYGNHNLGQQLSAWFLAQLREPRSALLRQLSQDTTPLRLLSQLHSLRNQSAHGDSLEGRGLEEVDLDEYKALVYGWINEDLDARGAPGGAGAGRAAPLSPAQAIAENQLLHYGAFLRMLPGARPHLLASLSQENALRELSRANRPADQAPVARDMVRNTCSLLEVALREALQPPLQVEIPAAYRKSKRCDGWLEACVQQSALVAPPGDALEGILQVKRSRLEAAMRDPRRKATLSALVATWVVFAAQEEHTHPARQLARQNPDALELLASMVQHRRHGQRPPKDITQAREHCRRARALAVTLCGLQPLDEQEFQG